MFRDMERADYPIVTFCLLPLPTADMKWNFSEDED